VNRALFAGLAGTMNNQTRLDIIGNNLANANTIGFKQSRVTFRDTYYQTLRSGCGSTAESGAVNPIQVGSGNALAGVQTLYTQGSLGSTGQALDAAVEGNGMFVLSDGETQWFTRDGSLALDDTYTLVSSHNGMRVQGWLADGGTIDTTAALTNLEFPMGQMTAGDASTEVAMGGNLDASATVGDSIVTSINVYDSLGAAHELTVTMTNNAAANTYDVEVVCAGTTATGQITFDELGVLATGSPVSISFSPGGGAEDPQVVNVDFSAVTQLAHEGNAAARLQNGRPAATLTDVSIQENGMIVGAYNDGRQVTLGRIALAAFANPAGLERTGNNLYKAGSATGEVLIGAADSGGRGRVVAQALELSNVDLTEAFVDMISTQRAFQASTRVISAADKLLEEVMRLAN
jgi:flagellar hook protein FlgE